ncbi:MAG: autotransporter-associated beta strand repeat-containing protein [Verrucomicrobiota bacterium]
MKIIPLPFRPLGLFILLAACRAYGDSATWTGDAADNNWATVANWSTTPAPFTPPASVPGTNPGETATFSGGIAGLITPLALPVAPPVTDPPTPPTPPSAVKFLNFEGAVTHTFAVVATTDPINRIAIEDVGAVTVAAGTAAQGTTANPVPLQITGSANINNNSSSVLTSNINYVGVAGNVLTFDGPGNITVSATMGVGAGGVVKKGSGTTTFNGNNSNIAGGFTIEAGTMIAGNNVNGFSNKAVTFKGGTAQMNANGTSNYTSATFTANTTLAVFNPSTGVIQWGFGQSAVANVLSSTGALVPPVLTFLNAGTVNNYISMNLTTAGFDGTWKVGTATSGCQLYLNSTNATGGPNVKVELGEAAATGLHVLGTSTGFASNGIIIPIVIGELKGTNTGALLAGRRNQGTRTTGTRYEVGGLGTDTSFSGAVADGVNSANGLRQMNGNPDCTASAAPDTVDDYVRTDGIAGAQGTVEFVKAGAGTLTLLSPNTHTGGTVLKGGVLAVSSDGMLGAAYDGSLRPFTCAVSTGIYLATDLPDASLAGGSPTTPAAIGLFSSQFGSWGANREFISFSSQNNDTDFNNITNTEVGAGYVSIPTVSFTGGTFSTPGDPPIATVRVKGLLTFDGGTLRTNAGITSNRATVLEAGGGTINTNTFNSTLSGVVNGGGSLTKIGTGKLSLTGMNTHTGDTIVTAGILSVNGTSITNTAKLTVTAGQVEVIANETVGTLVLGVTQQAAGTTYGATGSGAAVINDTYFIGPGKITVAGAPTGYAAWASTNAGNQTANLDFDNDGVKNGTEYFMNSAAGFTANPGSVGGVITWINGGNIPSAAYGTQFVVQTSTNLVNWTPVAAGDPNLSNTAGSVTYTLTGTGSRFARLVVTPN